jgi:hypothetical protein
MYGHGRPDSVKQCSILKMEQWADFVKKVQVAVYLNKEIFLLLLLLPGKMYLVCNLLCEMNS